MKTPLCADAAPAHIAFALLRFARLWIALGCAAFAVGAQPARAAVTEAWVQRYNSPANLNDTPSAVVVDGSGNVVVTGSTAYDTNSVGYTAKYAATTGALLWEKPGVGGGVVALDTSGNVVLARSSISGTGSTIYVAKYAAADGTLLWETHYSSPFNRYTLVEAVAVDGSGNVALTGGSGFGNPDFGSETTYTAEYAGADGSLLWEKTGNGTRSAVAFDISGNVTVAGSFWNGANQDLYTAKYAAANGALLWEKRYNGPANNQDFAKGLAVDSTGNVVVTGSSATGTRRVAYTAKYAAANGALLWQKTYNGPGDYYAAGKSVAVDGSGNVVVTVTVQVTTGPAYGASFEYTAKYGPANGTLLWEKLYYGPGNVVGGDKGATPFAVVVDGKGNAVVMGLSLNTAGNLDFYTAKYAAADGALLWEKRYDGPGFGDDRPWTANCLALGPNGMVAITGSSVGTSSYEDFATVVYWESLPPVSVAKVQEGVRLRFSSVPGINCTVLRAPTATGSWNPIATLLAPPNGLVDYVDTNSPTGQSFYRTSTP